MQRRTCTLHVAAGYRPTSRGDWGRGGLQARAGPGGERKRGDRAGGGNGSAGSDQRQCEVGRAAGQSRFTRRTIFRRRIFRFENFESACALFLNRFKYGHCFARYAESAVILWMQFTCLQVIQVLKKLHIQNNFTNTLPIKLNRLKKSINSKA